MTPDGYDRIQRRHPHLRLPHCEKLAWAFKFGDMPYPHGPGLVHLTEDELISRRSMWIMNADPGWKELEMELGRVVPRLSPPS